MGFHLVTDGQQYVLTNDIDADSWDVGLYNDSTDNPGVDATLTDITTEPDDGTYSRQGITLSVDQDGDFFNFDAENISFDVENTTGTVDGYFLVNGTGDLMLTGALEDSRDLGQIDQLDVEVVGGEFTTPA